MSTLSRKELIRLERIRVWESNHRFGASTCGAASVDAAVYRQIGGYVGDPTVGNMRFNGEPPLIIEEEETDGIQQVSEGDI